MLPGGTSIGQRKSLELPVSGLSAILRRFFRFAAVDRAAHRSRTASRREWSHTPRRSIARGRCAHLVPVAANAGPPPWRAEPPSYTSSASASASTARPAILASSTSSGSRTGRVARSNCRSSGVRPYASSTSAARRLSRSNCRERSSSCRDRARCWSGGSRGGWACRPT